MLLLAADRLRYLLPPYGILLPKSSLRNNAHVRRYHAPAFGKPYPSLHLAADLAGHHAAMEQGGSDGKVTPVRRDDCVRERAGKACGRARRAEGLDLRIP